MIDSQKNSPEIGLTEVSGSISDTSGPKTRKTTSERNHNPVSRLFALLAEGKRSPTAAIAAGCAHCMGCTAKEQGQGMKDWIEPGFREQIRNCTSSGCPSWQFRPFQGGAK
jgi:hypothetical protein